MNKAITKRLLEAVPALLSWTILIGLLMLVLIAPLSAAIVLIIYLLYWMSRLLHMTTLLLTAHFRMHYRRHYPWLEMSQQLKTDLLFENILHVVLYPIYKESPKLLEESLDALIASHYPKENMLVVLAGERREAGAQKILETLKQKYQHYFRDILVTLHPDDIVGEIPSKGANATYAAKQVCDYLKDKNQTLENVIISCFDADTCPDKNYFSCLTYNFLANDNRYRTSYQPLPIYNNNIYQASALARAIEIGSTFWQLIESMRYGKVITFSSHSMSFKTLVEVGYWPVDMISDDSVIFWKCFLHYGGDYKTYPLERPVYMDIAVGKNTLDTIKVQYKQKRRWAWGVENFVFLAMHFLEDKRIPLFTKIRKICQLLDNHVNWATWAIIVSFITPFFIYFGKIEAENSLVFFNLSFINHVIFYALLLVLLISVIISKYFIPPRPANVSRMIYIGFILQWLLLPFISALLGSFPALDAQTRLLLGISLVFKRTKKTRDVAEK
jgi:cellulose synthase/poly-beta-1,6-N-acetylglucosamine synthase-like glycosyltransferase